MSEHQDGPLLYRAVVVEKPQESDYGNVRFTVCCRDLKRREIEVVINSINPQKKAVLLLSKGDELYVSADGEDIDHITFNPWWRRLWLRLVW